MHDGSADSSSWLSLNVAMWWASDLFQGLLWGIAGYVVFLLVRSGDRRWPIGALLTALAAVVPQFLSALTFSLWAGPRLPYAESWLVGFIVNGTLTGLTTFAGFAIARLILRHRLFAAQPTN
jgi:hypothetical protein